MLHTTITLSSDQAKLVAEEAKALDKESTEAQLKLLSDSGQKLFGSLERKIFLRGSSRAPSDCETGDEAASRKKIRCGPRRCSRGDPTGGF
ncbi:hypothetical protein ARSEF4850_003540 [Beauveria asiatica]